MLGLSRVPDCGIRAFPRRVLLWRSCILLSVPRFLFACYDWIDGRIAIWLCGSCPSEVDRTKFSLLVAGKVHHAAGLHPFLLAALIVGSLGLVGVLVYNLAPAEDYTYAGVVVGWVISTTRVPCQTGSRRGIRTMGTIVVRLQVTRTLVFVVRVREISVAEISRTRTTVVVSGVVSVWCQCVVVLYTSCDVRGLHVVCSSGSVVSSWRQWCRAVLHPGFRVAVLSACQDDSFSITEWIGGRKSSKDGAGVEATRSSKSSRDYTTFLLIGRRVHRFDEVLCVL